jgi:hypothetical protein
MASELLQIDVRLRVSPEMAQTIARLVAERGTSYAGLFRQAIGLLKVVHDGEKEGLYAVMTAKKPADKALVVVNL